MKAAKVRRSNSPKPIDKSDPYRHGTRLRQARDKAKKEAWLATPEGKAAMEKINMADTLSSELVKKMYQRRYTDEDIHAAMLRALELDKEIERSFGIR